MPNRIDDFLNSLSKKDIQELGDKIHSKTYHDDLKSTIKSFGQIYVGYNEYLLPLIKYLDSKTHKEISTTFTLALGKLKFITQNYNKLPPEEFYKKAGLFVYYASKLDDQVCDLLTDLFTTENRLYLQTLRSIKNMDSSKQYCSEYDFLYSKPEKDYSIGDQRRKYSGSGSDGYDPNW